MFSIFEQEKAASIVMLVCMAGSILIRVGLGLMYLHLIREADNMASTRSRQLKQCKLKFANCYQLNRGMPNVPIFVDKFISRMSLGPLSPHMLENLSGQLMLLSVVSAGIGVCRRIIAGSTLGQILPFYIVSLLGLYLYFSVSAIVDLKGKRRVLKINLVDYLENHLSSRMEVTQEDMEMLYGEDAAGKGGRRRRGVRTGVDVIPVGSRGVDPARNIRESRPEPEAMQKAAGESYRPEFTASQEQELEQLLKEFLTS
ncbi:MAG: hypothetical protein NC543_08740 [bacterium]|nr:hypothetical protein [bacterium]MCM1375532.1 hypothetical protein [Muribaculum sp.]